MIKGGAIAWAALGDPNASIPTPQPVLMRPAFGDAIGADVSFTFVSPAALDDGLAERCGCAGGCSPYADAGDRQGGHEEQRCAAEIDIDPETFAIKVDGDLVEPAPAEVLPLAQLYAMF